ncbi:MAG TPA: phosphoribosylanthranilate isomerase [Rhodopila sp.]|jgi:phosphoribosylanthranilate isomerase|nr:phosphoribosylanthranilate isomerase [Rhodopila sp.]
MIEVKICGVNDPAAFDAAVEGGADWVGFVFFPPSPRYVTPQQALNLSRRSPAGPPRVGLFVRPTWEDIQRVTDVVKLDILQLYGVKDFTEIRGRFSGQIWQAIGVSAEVDLPSKVEVAIDRLLVEPKPPPGANRPGGNAVTLDWTITSRWESPRPWILAGGLNPDNVREAIVAAHATAVDVSSGVEAAVGVKSPDRIRTFISAAKAAGV